MILDAHSGLRGVFVDDASGRPVRWVVWYDTETTEYEAFRCDPEVAAKLGVEPIALRYRGKARLRFIPATPAKRPSPTDPRDAAGSMQEAKRLWSKPLLLLPGRECDEPHCHQLAGWRTAVERVIEPVVGVDGVAYKRSIVLEIKNWCAKHYRWPQRISARGVESETLVACRPQ